MTITTRKLKLPDGTFQHAILLTQTGRECLYPLPAHPIRDAEAKEELRKLAERLTDWIDGVPYDEGRI